MPLPSDCISATALICEKVLREDDDVISAIRLVDVFQFKRDTNIPPEIQAVTMHVLVLLKFKPESTASHNIRLRLLRPSGQLIDATKPVEVSHQPSRYPTAVRGAVLNALAPVLTKEEGLHWWVVYLDDEEAARAGFTLLEAKDNAEK